MMSKNFITLMSITAILLFLSTGCSSKKECDIPNQTSSTSTHKQETIKPKPIIKKYDLYSNTPYDLPLFSIVDISKLPQNIKTLVDNILDSSQGFYFLKFDGEKVLILLQNPINTGNTYSRQNLQFVEIDLQGQIIYHNAGYVGVDGETNNIFEENKKEVWNYQENAGIIRPVKHISYDEKNKIKFTELWNYDENEPIKYQMQDSYKKTISMLKETQENDSNYRREHLFYDNDGNITMSLTINYDGANISRLTFYNSHDSIDSMSIISEYKNGLKTKELIYNEEYKLVSTILSEYVDNERKRIIILDENGAEINKIES